MRRALAVGIDHYDVQRTLRGCVADANAMADLLARHHDDSPNFEVRLLTSAEDAHVSRTDLRKHVEDLLAHEADVALLFFAGHGTEINLGGYLMPSEATRYDEGFPMRDVLTFARDSPVKEIIVILDCCQAGAFGSPPEVNNDALISEGLAVLMASRATQTAAETGGRGLFSTLVCSALEGGAADTLGKVTVASIYAYVDEALGSWSQRPMFKAHVSKLLPVRQAQPSVPLADLRELTTWFPTIDHEFSLDPSFEPTEEPHDDENERVFGRLQKMRAAKLVEPSGDEEHMYYAALNSGSCRLTQLGQLYWRMVRGKRI